LAASRTACLPLPLVDDGGKFRYTNAGSGGKGYTIKVNVLLLLLLLLLDKLQFSAALTMVPPFLSPQ